MNDCLVLNRAFFAVHICDWKRVMTLLFTGNAVVVDEDFRQYNFEEWKDLSQYLESYKFIHTSNFKIAIPEVISLTHYDEMPSTEVKFTRKNLYKHYHYKCCYCGKRFDTKDLNLDHVIPKSRGGITNWQNIVLSCYQCNSVKGSRTPKEAGMQMSYQPNKPEWRPMYAVKLDPERHMKKSWQKFIDSIYWGIEIEQE